jgi:hypothetical protein
MTVNRRYSNVVVHIAGALDAAGRARLESVLGSQPGVARAYGSARARQLAIVDYDPRATSATAILRTVEAHGFDARLVGM